MLRLKMISSNKGLANRCSWKWQQKLTGHNRYIEKIISREGGAVGDLIDELNKAATCTLVGQRKGR